MEEIVAKEAKVKEVVGDEVVEVKGEEMVEEKVKEEVEEKVVEERVVEAGQWLRVCLGARTAGVIMDLPWDPAVLDHPHPANLDNPLLVSPESPIWTLRFLLHHVHHKILGQRRGGGGGNTPRQTPASGVGYMRLLVASGVAQEEERGSGPSFRQGGEDV